MVATLFEAFENNYNNDNSEQQIIESYRGFINTNVPFSTVVSSKRQGCINNNNNKPVLIPPWFINDRYEIVFSLPKQVPQKPIYSVLPTYELNEQCGYYNTDICGNLKGFTFKAYRLLVETINRYKNDSSAQFFAPNNYIDLEQGWHVVRWKPPIPPIPPQPKCSQSGGPCGAGQGGKTCCSGLTCKGGYYGRCE